MKIKVSPTKVVVAGAMLLVPALLFAAHKDGGPVSGAPVEHAPVYGGATKTPASKSSSQVVSALARLPLSFEKNLGQTDASVQYVAHGQDYQLFLTKKEAVLALRSAEPVLVSPRDRVAYLKAVRDAELGAKVSVLRFQLAGASASAEISGENQLPGKTNYFVGNDPKKWHTDVPSYGRVGYRGIYPGVDLVFYGNQRRLEYDFVVAPGADPKSIALNVEGARKLRVAADGSLVLNTLAGDVQFEKPVVYQEVNGERLQVAGSYAISGGHKVTFAISKYDASKPLIIDPVLNYSTYLGGSTTGSAAADTGYGIAVDASGDAYIAGITYSTTFPNTASAFNQSLPGANTATNGTVFVTELNPAGTAEIYSTYLSGSGTMTSGDLDYATAIAIDPAPSTNCPNAMSAPGICIYVTGQTYSTDFPTTLSNALNPGPLSSNALSTSFLSKLNPGLSGSNSLAYSTFLGGATGTYGTFGYGVAVDAAANAYVVGFTDTSDFPQPTIPNGYQTSLPNANGNVFLARIDTTLTGTASLIYSTYLGGNGVNPGYNAPGDQANGVAVDSTKNAYITGTTSSTDFPTTTTGSHIGFQTTLPTGNMIGTGFVSVISTNPANTAGTGLIYSTYLGGNGADTGNGIALGPGNVAYVTGATNSTSGFPTTSGAYSTTAPTSTVVFVTLIDASQTGSGSLKYSTFMGGNGSDLGNGIKTDTLGNAYVAGEASSTNFPLVPLNSGGGAFQVTRPDSGGDAFISELSPLGNGTADLLYSSYFGGDGSGGSSPDEAYAIALDSANNVYITGKTYSAAATFPVFPSNAFQTALTGTGAAFVAKLTLEPRMPVSPATLTFTGQVVGVPSMSQSVTLTNSTNGTVTLSAPTITAGSPPASATDFAATNGTCTTSLAAGASCTVNVTFTASVTANESATLNLNSNDLSSPQQVALASTGTVAAVVTVSPSPTSVTFTSQVVGTTSSPAQTLTITNSGNAPLTFSAAASITGTNGTPSSDFAIVSGSGTTCTNGATVQPNATCTIALTFSPSGTTPNLRTANLSLTDNGTGTPQQVALSGTAVASAPILTITSPTPPLTFASQVVGTTSTAQTVTITNTGNAALNFTAAPAITGTNGTPGTDYTIVTGSGTTCTNGAVVQANATCTIAITFTPSGTTPNPRTATLTLTDNASPMGSLAITGTAAVAAPVASVTPTSLTFTGQLVTTTSTAQTVTVKNTGGAALTFAAQAISTTGDFSQTNTCNGTSLAANATCTISVTFTPTTSGTRSGTVSIADNAAGTPQTVTLTGTGEDYTVTATAPSAIAPGQSASIPVTVIGLGGYTGSVSFSCSGSIPGGSCVAPAAVNAAPAPGATATFMVTTTSFVTPPPARRIPPVSPRQVVLLLTALLLLFSVAAARRLRTRLSLLGAMLLFIVLAGCAGTPVTPTPAGPYSFTITAASGGVNHVVNVTVTVN